MALRSAFGPKHLKAAGLCALIDAPFLVALNSRVRQLGLLS